MIIDHANEKITNVITYLINNTAWFGKKKLYKLLNVLDFEHFQQTGRSVTGFDYYAWRMGPVPAALDEAIENQYDEITTNFRVEFQVDKRGYKILYMTPKDDFDAQWFSKREMALLESVAERFKLDTGDEMVWFTHRESEPWYRVWEIEGRRNRDKIPYEYAVYNFPEKEKALILDLAEERSLFLSNFS